MENFIVSRTSMLCQLSVKKRRNENVCVQSRYICLGVLFRKQDFFSSESMYLEVQYIISLVNKKTSIIRQNIYQLIAGTYNPRSRLKCQWSYEGICKIERVKALFLN